MSSAPSVALITGTSPLDAVLHRAQLEAEVVALKEALAARERRIQLLEEALRCLKAERYGASREQLAGAPGQRGLFNEVEVLAELAAATGVEPPLSATPLREVKPASPLKPGRRALAAHLPRREVRHELPASEQVGTDARCQWASPTACCDAMTAAQAGPDLDLPPLALPFEDPRFAAVPAHALLDGFDVFARAHRELALKRVG